VKHILETGSASVIRLKKAKRIQYTQYLNWMMEAELTSELSHLDKK
jgi:hypothetical protein